MSETAAQTFSEALAMLVEELSVEQAECVDLCSTLAAQASRFHEWSDSVVRTLQDDAQASIAHIQQELIDSISSQIEDALGGELERGKEAFCSALNETLEDAQAVPSVLAGEFQEISNSIAQRVQEEIVGEIERVLTTTIRHATERVATSTLEMVVTTEFSEMLTTALQPYAPVIITFHRIAPAIQVAVDFAKGPF